MSQFDVLDPTLNLSESYFLEASAGTGKTFAIEHLIVRLVTEGNEPLALPQVLAVTFTKEAAHEMKARLYGQLQTKESDAPAIARRRKEAWAMVDQLQVFTIHGFCARMLAEFAFEAQLPFGAAEGMDWIESMRETVKDVLRIGDPEYGGEISALIKEARFEIQTLIDRIVSAMQNPIPPTDCLLPSALPLASEEELLHDVLLLAPRYKWFKLDASLGQLHKLVTFLQSNHRSLLLEERGWFFEKMVETNVKVKAPPLASYSLKAPHVWEALATLLTPHLPLLRDKQQIVRRIASLCRKRWEEKAKKEGIYTFDDLLVQMRAALDLPAFLEKVQGKYKAVIVDEFQDTDKIQWAIFEKLFLPSHLLYLVGDPKQSIYGFRNADIYTYMAARRAMGEERCATLGTNFRSSPPLIDRLNALFTHVPAWIELPALPGELSYHPVQAGRETATLDEPPVELVVFSAEQGKAKSWPSKALEEEHLFPFIGWEIVRLHQEKGVPLEEIAVLIKDRFQGQRLQLHLKKWNLPSTIKRTFHLTQTRGFLAFEDLLRAVESPSKPAHALLGPLIRLETVEDHPFRALHTLFLEQGFAPFYRTLLQTPFGGRTIFEKLHALQEDRLIQEVEQTAELLMESGPTTFAALFELIDLWKRSSPEEVAGLAVHEAASSKVPLLTTFASKGLEFDVVIALALACRHWEALREEQAAEEMRELYVGFTRPREKLYIPFFLKEDESALPLATASAIELFFHKWNLPPLALFAELEQKGIPVTHPPRYPLTPLAPIEQAATSLSAPPPLDLTFPTYALSSFTSLAQPHTGDLLSERFMQQNLESKTVHTLPLGVETGILIHSLFQTHFENRTTPLPEIVWKTLSATSLEGYEEVILAQMEKVLALPLLPSFCLSDLREGTYLEEMELVFPQEERVIKGFADLVFEHKGNVYLVDWKTNWLGPSDADYSKERLESVMREHDYFLQARLYGEGLKRYVKQFDNRYHFAGAIYLFFRGSGVYYIWD